MKKLTLQLSLAIVVTYSTIFVKPQSASAQVDMSLLTEVAKSCQKDAVLLEYYKQMGFDDDKLQAIKNPDISLDLTDTCIFNRYYHSLVQSKFPWLASTGEIISGYPGSVAVSIIGLKNYQSSSSLLDCIVSQDSSSQVCGRSSDSLNASSNYGEKIVNSGAGSEHFRIHAGAYIYICPSCVIAYDNTLSPEKMTRGFIQWFLRLDKPKRREVMSILGDEQEQTNNREKINEESRRAAAKYKEIREKVNQQEENRRRREVLGN